VLLEGLFHDWGPEQQQTVPGGCLSRMPAAALVCLVFLLHVLVQDGRMHAVLL
jgi:hypothetical protein